MPTLTIDCAELHYETQGDGPPLLLIAGLASDSASWGPVAPLLARSFTLIMPDNRGCGRTEDDGGALSIDRFARDCAALLDHLGHARADIVGHSMGGATAMRLAAISPDRVGRLVLAASAPSTPPRARSVIDTLVALREAGAPEDEWHRAFFHWLFRPSFFDNKTAVDAGIAMALAYPHRQSAGDMRRQVEALRAHDPAADAERVNAKTLVIGGAHDLLFPRETLEAAAAKLDARLAMLDAGHSVHWDAPAAFAAAVGDFLSAQLSSPL